MTHFTTRLSAKSVRITSQIALSLLFVSLLSFVAHNSTLFPQIYALEQQNNGSAINSEKTQKSDCELKEKEKYYEPVRLRSRDKLPVSLETAVVRYQGQYRADDGVERNVSVDLIGAIHLADQAYYDALNNLFAEYETVVYELVSDPNVDVAAMIEASKKTKNEKQPLSLNPLNLVSVIQEASAKLFKLCYQIDGIDYSAANLKRGDCSSQELIVETIKNGDFLDFFVSLGVNSFKPADVGLDVGVLVAILCANDRRLIGKRIVGQKLAESSIVDFRAEARALEAESTTSESNAFRFVKENAIIHFRNKKALDVARRELNAGKTKIALFYGAAHLPDLGKRLQTDFGLQLNDELKWLEAWSLEPKEHSTSPQ